MISAAKSQSGISFNIVMKQITTVDEISKHFQREMKVGKVKVKRTKAFQRNLFIRSINHFYSVQSRSFLIFTTTTNMDCVDMRLRDMYPDGIYM